MKVAGVASAVALIVFVIASLVRARNGVAEFDDGLVLSLALVNGLIAGLLLWSGRGRR